MRTVDHIDIKKHLKAIRKIHPICASKMVYGTGTKASESGIGFIADHPEAVVQTARYLVDWKGRKIRVGLVVGGLDEDGEPYLSKVGMLCLDQWMQSHPDQAIVFAEFKGIATGNLSQITVRLTEILNTAPKDAVIMLAAKNSTMYDKIAALIGAIEKEKPHRLFPGQSA